MLIECGSKQRAATSESSAVGEQQLQVPAASPVPPVSRLHMGYRHLLIVQSLQSVPSRTESASEHTLNTEVATENNANHEEDTQAPERLSMRTWRQTNVLARRSISHLLLRHQNILSEEADFELEERYLPGAWPEQAEIERLLREREMAPVSSLSISVFNNV
jgi:hypothetical protein